MFWVEIKAKGWYSFSDRQLGRQSKCDQEGEKQLLSYFPSVSPASHCGEPWEDGHGGPLPLHGGWWPESVFIISKAICLTLSSRCLLVKHFPKEILEMVVKSVLKRIIFGATPTWV